MANYAPDKPGMAGAAPSVRTAATNDAFDNNGKVMLRITNGGGSSITCKVDDPNSALTAATTFDPDVTITVPNGQVRVAGPFPAARFNDANGRVNMVFSATASVTWEAYYLE